MVRSIVLPNKTVLIQYKVENSNCSRNLKRYAVNKMLKIASKAAVVMSCLNRLTKFNYHRQSKLHVIFVGFNWFSSTSIPHSLQLNMVWRESQFSVTTMELILHGINIAW